MSRKEQKSLIHRRSHGYEDEEEKQLSKKRIFLCCCLCVLILLLIFIAVIFIRKYKPPSSSKLQTKSPDKELCKELKTLDLSKKDTSKNLSEYSNENKKLCDKLTSKEQTETAENMNHVYIVKGTNNITEVRACGIESILRLFPDKTIYLIDFNKRATISYDRCSNPTNYLGLLLYLYKDRLELIHADRQQFFKDTPLQNVTKKEENLEFFAILLTAYRYGGFVMTPDFAMTKRDFLECYPEETIVEPFVVFAAQRCDDFLHYLMQSFEVCGQPGSLNLTLDNILTESTKVYSKSVKSHSARRLNDYEVCKDVESQDPCPFLKLRQFVEGDGKWVNELSSYCKQVVQAFLGIKINKMEVDEETSKIKSSIRNGKKTCGYGYKFCDT